MINTRSIVLQRADNFQFNNLVFLPTMPVCKACHISLSSKEPLVNTIDKSQCWGEIWLKKKSTANRKYPLSQPSNALMMIYFTTNKFFWRKLRQSPRLKLPTQKLIKDVESLEPIIPQTLSNFLLLFLCKNFQVSRYSSSRDGPNQQRQISN